MRGIWGYLRMVLVGAPLTLAASPAFAQSTDRNPRFPISIADVAPQDAVRNGPLFNLVKSQLTPTNAALRFTDDVWLYISSKKAKLTNRPDIDRFFKSLTEDCRGPFPIDEGKSPDGDRAPWLQTSFVCDVAPGLPVREYFNFDVSPEADVEFDFEGDRVKSVFVVELKPLPGRRLLKMDAAKTIGANTP